MNKICNLCVTISAENSNKTTNLVSYFFFLLVSSSGKNIILVVMHHTREPDYSTGIINWAEKDPTVKLQVDVLFHQTQQGLLQCARNEQAIRKIQSAIQTL